MVYVYIILNTYKDSQDQPVLTRACGHGIIILFEVRETFCLNTNCYLARKKTCMACAACKANSNTIQLLIVDPIIDPSITGAELFE
jgi:hypothetical protein